jgi:hypothetical protein
MGIVILCLLTSVASASSKKTTGPPPPGSKAALAAALTSAKTVYLRFGGDETNAADYPVDYAAFYQDMQVWGKYQLLPSTKGADLVIIYGAYCRNSCLIEVYDGQTMAWIGEILHNLGGSSIHVSNADRSNGAKNFVKTLAKYAGTTAPKDGYSGKNPPPAPIPPVPSWAVAAGGTDSAPRLVQEHISQGVLHPATPAFQDAFLAWIKTAHNVLIVDDELTMSQRSQLGRTDTLPLFKQDLNQWGRYKEVSSLAEADFVIDVSTTTYCDKDSCDSSLNVRLEDPQTLRVLAVASVAAYVYYKKGQSDPFPSSMQSFVNAIRGLVGDPVQH